MKKMMIIGMIAMAFTSCVTIKNERLATEAQLNWSIEKASHSTKSEVTKQTSATTSQTSCKSDIRHKEGWIHPAAR